MPSEAINQLVRALDERKSDGSIRALTTPSGLIDFCSNDYLGFSRSHELKENIRAEIGRLPDMQIGSTGSRLISGNSKYCEELENKVAEFHHAEAGLIFNSGYDANLGIFSSIPQRTDTVLYDQLVHASIRDGIRLSYARSFTFRHNDLDDLERRLNQATGNVYVAVESVYSMDGDSAPLREIAQLCSSHGANLVVDEAHATGVFGENGEGRVVELDVQDAVFARVHTFGKALGAHGAVILGSETLRSYLVNFARPFIYTTALPFHSLAAIHYAYKLLISDYTPCRRLRHLISIFNSQLDEPLKSNFIGSDSAIRSLLKPGNRNVKKVANDIRSGGFDVRPIMHPTVPAGSERIRICIHAFNTEEEIGNLIHTLNTALT